MKRHKAPGLSGLVAEMIIHRGYSNSTDTGFMSWNCETTLYPRGLQVKYVLPVYKGKGDPMKCGSYRGIKLLKHAKKVVERIFENRIRQQIDI